MSPHPSYQLLRRGVDHGVLHARQCNRGPDAPPAMWWREGSPIYLPGAAHNEVAAAQEAIEETTEVFELFRQGTRFLDFVEQRLWDDPLFRYAGSTFDREDEREIEKVYVDVRPGESRIARDLWGKLSWIAHDEDDTSLRVRFSFGHEKLGDWSTDEKRTLWADEFARRCFPESVVVDECSNIKECLDSLLADPSPQPWRLSERIIYSNAAGGGALFHHDGDAEQLGVVFTQLSGVSAWLALSASELRKLLNEYSGEAMAAALGDESSRELDKVLNQDPAFTQRLIEAGHAYFLEAGDVLLLPSLSTEQTAWHSVFGLSEEPGLGHSYGLFAWDGTAINARHAE